jgi:ABC-type multidrug transport system fused ATPase/permease subunit
MEPTTAANDGASASPRAPWRRLACALGLAPEQGLPGLWARGRRRLLVLLVANHALQAAAAVAAVLCGRALVDSGAGTAGLPWAGLLLGLASAVALLRSREGVLAEALAQQHVAAVRLVLFDALAGQDAATRQRRSRGGVLLRFVGDAQALRQWSGNGLPQLLAAAGAVLALLAGLAALDPALAGFGSVWLLAACLWMRRTLPRVSDGVRTSRRRLAQVAANLHERVQLAAQMVSDGQVQRQRSRLRGQLERLQRAHVERARADARHRLALDTSLVMLAAAVLARLMLDPASGGTLGLASLWAVDGTLVGAIGLLAIVSAPLRRLGTALQARTGNQVARERLIEFVGAAGRSSVAPAPLAAPLAPAPLAAPTPSACVAGAAASRAPDHTSVPGLDLAFDAVAVPGRLAAQQHTVPHGARVAVTGPGGSGKSTLLALLADPAAAHRGVLSLGGIDWREWSEAERARRVAFVAPEQLLRRGTVEANLRERWRRAPPEALHRACALAGLGPTAPDPQWLRRRVGEGGGNLGGNERRALLLARALLGEPDVLVIDELERCLPAPVADSMDRLLAGFGGSLIFSTSQPELAGRASLHWTLQPVPPAGVDANATAAPGSAEHLRHAA